MATPLINPVVEPWYEHITMAKHCTWISLGEERIPVEVSYEELCCKDVITLAEELYARIRRRKLIVAATRYAV